MNDNYSLQNISHLRREYTYGGLKRKDLPNNPLILFEQWLNQACEAHIPDPTAMIIATVDCNSQPYQRAVLLKQYDDHGMVFYTNLHSRKALHLRINPLVSLYFPWYLLDRQVMILGPIEKLSPLEVLKYFHSRPRGSQISAWSSKQSTKLSSKDVLKEKFIQFKQKFKDSKIPLPSFWGGFRVKLNTIEFWQGGEHRLHDRFIYQRLNRRNGWKIDRLAP